MRYSHRPQSREPMAKNTFSFVYFAIAILFISTSAYSSQVHSSTLTRFLGKVTILINPSEKVNGNGPHALYEGKYYTSIKPKTGITIPLGSVVQTGPKSRARIVFDNGDHISVTSNSYFHITKNPEKPKENKPLIDVLFGAFRAAIEKDGPRSDLEVKSRTLSMGVRGTEFHFDSIGKSGTSSVTVIRGKVTVKPKATSKPILVTSGYSIEVPKAREAKDDDTKFVPKKTSKEKIIAISKSTSIKKPSSPLPKAIADKVKALESKAKETVLKDIKSEDPELYKSIKDAENKGDVLDVDSIQSASLKKAFRKAPSSKQPKRKPSAEDLEIEDDDIDKYFDN